MTITCIASIQVRRKLPTEATSPQIGCFINPSPACLCPNVKRFFWTPNVAERRHIFLTNVRITSDPGPSRHATWFRRPRQIADSLTPEAPKAHERSLPVPISATLDGHGQRKRVGIGDGAVYGTSVLHN